LEDALIHSRNLATVNVAQTIGLPAIARTVQDFDIMDKMPLYYSMALGAGETTLLRLTSAYAMLDNDGHWLLPSLIDLVQDRDGKILYQKGAKGCAACFVSAGPRNGPDTSTRKVYQNPKRIAVIIDKAVASAGEAFITGLKETSSKVTLYGANTFGMIDYMNVNTLPVGDKTCNWYYFGYPTFFSKDIKTKPLNPTGIKPDIYIPANTPDWITWVKDDLEKK